MHCPFCKTTVAWKTERDPMDNSGGMGPSLRVLACRNAACLVKPRAQYLNQEFRWHDDPEVKAGREKQGYYSANHDARYETAWRASEA